MRYLFKFVKWTGGLLVLAYGAMVLYAYWPDNSGVPVSELASAEDRFVELGDISLRYREYGQAGNGRPELMLIHGFANNLHSFRDLAPLLADCCHVIAVDLPGFGLSAKPADPRYYTYDAMAQNMAQVARAVGFKKPIYVGHSLGGLIGLLAELEAPTSAGLILIDPGLYADVAAQFAGFTSIFPLPRLSAKQFGKRDFRVQMISASYQNSDVLTDADIDNLMIAAQTDDYLTGMTAMLSHPPSGEPATDKISMVKAPVLSFWSTQNGKPRPDMARLKSDLPDSRNVVVQAAGHYIHEEQPELVAEEIKRSLREWGQTPTFISLLTD